MIKCELNSHSDDTGSEYTVKCSGTLLIAEADGLRETLSQCLGQADSIKIDLGEAERIDTACIQLFMSLAKSAAIKSKKLEWKNIPDPISEAFDYLNVKKVFSARHEDTAGGVS